MIRKGKGISQQARRRPKEEDSESEEAKDEAGPSPAKKTNPVKGKDPAQCVWQAKPNKREALRKNGHPKRFGCHVMLCL